MKYNIQYLKDQVWKCYFWIKSRKCLVSPADYLYLRPEGLTFSQLIICTRILDIEQWMKDFRPKFHYANALTLTINKNFDTETADRHFADLLESVKREGYNPESRISLNNEYTVNDGTHRAALAFCLKMESVPAKYINYPPHWHKQQLVDASRNKEFHADYLKIQQRIEDIQTELKSSGYTCSCTITNVEIEQQGQLMAFLTGFANVICKYRLNVDSINKLDAIKRKEILGDDSRIHNGYYFSIMPQYPDYNYSQNRLVFHSITQLRKKLSSICTHVVVKDNFVDGVSHYNKIKDYLL